MHHAKRTIRFAAAVIVIASLGVACSSSSSSKSACESEIVTNKDLLQAIGATAASSVNAGHKLGNNDGYYVARADGALWVTSFPPVSNGQGGLVVPLNPQARLDAPDVGVDVPPNAPILKDFSDTDSRASTAVGCASASPSSG